MGNELARLFVVIGASTKDFNKEIGDVEKNIKSTMGNIKKELLKAGEALTGFGLAVTITLGKAVEQFTEFGTELTYLSEKTGIGVESLSELKYVGDMTGVSLDNLTIAIRGMANFLETARDGSSAAAKALREIHLSIAQLQGLSPEQMFMTLTSAIAEVPDPLTRSALAVDIFGRSGTDLLPMLALGQNGIQMLRDRAQELGLTMSGETAESAHALSDAFITIKDTVGGLANEIGAALAPTLTWIAGIITSVITHIHSWIDTHPELFKWIMIVAGGIGLLALAVGGLLLALAGIIIIAPAVAAAFAPIAALGGLSAAAIGGIVIAIMAVIAAIALLVIYWEEVWNGIKWFTRAVVNFLINQVLELVNFYVNIFIGLINAVISLLDLIPGVNISKVAQLNLHYEIPEFAAGGLITRPTLGIIGESGPEAVMPLSALGSIGGGSGGNKGTTTINIKPGFYTDREVGDWIRKIFYDFQNSNYSLNFR